MKLLDFQAKIIFNLTMKPKAIDHAKKNVSEIYAFGNQYQFSWFDETVNARRESGPMDYFRARSYRSQKLVDLARGFLGLEPVEYIEGSWRDYV